MLEGLDQDREWRGLLETTKKTCQKESEDL